MEKQILEVVLNIQANQIEMQKDIKDLQENQKNMQKDIKVLQVGQKDLQKNQKNMQNDIKDLQSGQTEILKRIDSIEKKQRIDSINIAKILEVQVKQFNSRIV